MNALNSKGGENAANVIACSKIYTGPTAKKLLFNPKTKEVFDTYNNFLGYGEFGDGILTIKYSTS